MASPRTELRLLGRFAFEPDTGPVDLCGNAQRLLAFTVLRGPVPRTVVAGTLWPDVPEERARGSLRTALWSLRHVARPPIGCRGDCLLPSADLRVDAHVVAEAELAVIQGRGPLPPCPPRELTRQEDLLPGWDDAWLLPERERLRQLRLHALDLLADALARRGQPALALEAAWASIRAEPLRESAHRAVVSVHVAEGNLAEAVRHYQAFRRALRSELGVEPSPRFAEVLPTRPRP